MIQLGAELLFKSKSSSGFIAILEQMEKKFELTFPYAQDFVGMVLH